MKNGLFVRGGRLCAAVLLAMCVSVCSYAEQTGRDYDGHWAAGSIDFVLEKGIMSCTGAAGGEGPEGEEPVPLSVFAPEEGMTRAMFVEALAGAADVRFSGEKEEAATSGEAIQWGLVAEAPEIYVPDLKKLDEMFDDMDGTEPFAPAVAWAVEQGIVNGTGTGFSPHELLDRQTLSVLMYRAVGALHIALAEDWSVILDFSDLDQAGEWAIEGISYCYMTGLMNGDSSGAFAPKRTLTRAEGAAVLERFYHRIHTELL